MKMVKQCFIVFLITLSLLLTCNESVDCSFSASGHSLDLSSLGQVQTAYKQWTFILSMCQNSLQCNSQQVMALQDNQGSCTAYLALYLSSITPSYSSKSGGTWVFNYANGDSANCDNQPRKLNLYFVCSSSSAAYDFSTTYVEEASQKCTYNWYIYTSSACSGGGGSGSSSDEMSPGSVMILIVVILIVLYCVVGYIINWKRSADQDWKDFKEHTPHLSFWCMIPKWTWAGCCVTKEWTMTKYEEYRGGGGGSAQLVADNEDEEA